MADDSLKGLLENLGKSKDEVDKLLASFLKLQQAVKIGEDLKSAIPVIRELAANGEQIAELSKIINSETSKVGGEYSKLGTAARVVGDTMEKTWTAANTEAVTMLGNIKDGIVGLTQQERLERATVEHLLLSNKDTDKLLAKEIARNKVLSLAKANSKGLWDNTKGTVRSLFDMSSILDKAMNSFGQMAANKFLQSGVGGGNYWQKMAAGGAGGKSGGAGGAGGAGGRLAAATADLADKTAEQARAREEAKEQEKETTEQNKEAGDAAEDAAKKGSDAVQKGAAAVFGGFLAVATAALALSFSLAKQKIQGTLNYINTSGNDTAKSFDGVNNAAKNYIEDIARVGQEFLGSSEEAQSMVNALQNAIPKVSRFGWAADENTLNIAEMRKAEIATGQSLEQIASGYANLYYLTGQTSGLQERLNRIQGMYYQAAVKGRDLQARGNMTQATFMEAWKQASEGTRGFAQNQEFLINATHNAAIGLQAMGRDTREAGAIMATIAQSFGNVDDSIKMIALAGQGFDAISNWQGMSTDQQMKAVMGSGLGNVLKAGSQGYQMYAFKTMLGMDYATSSAMQKGKVLETAPGTDREAIKKMAENSAQLTEVTRKNAGEMMDIQKKMERALAKIAEIAGDFDKLLSGHWGKGKTAIPVNDISH